MEFRVLAIGDVTSEEGTAHLRRHLPGFKKMKGVDFTVINGENISGTGLTPQQADDLFAAGADVITLGNHTWGKMQITDYLEDNRYILRPANFSPRTPGRGCGVYDLGRVQVAVLCLITGGMGELVPAQLVATALVCVGVVGLGIVEAHEDEDLRRKRQEAANRRYAKSALALLLPIIYCILDAAGTFADSRVLDKLSARALAEGMFATADECSDYAASAANCAYELTFLLAGIVCFVYVVLIRKQKLIARQEAPKYAGAAFETAGQFAYIFALSDTAHVAISAPIISAYCVASVVWSRIFLKEKLSLKHYLMIALVVAGIVILGVYDA